MPRSRRTGKYEDVLEEYGKEGFGIPSKAPHVGSFPLYPIGRARYALVLIASPSYDGKEAQREQIRKRALKAHPSLKSFWKKREETINDRMSGEMRMAANPSGEKQIVLRSESREELEALVPVAVDALLEMGADSVEVSPVERDVPRGAGLHFIHYKVRFTVEGLGRGRRFSRGHRQQFREIVLALLPMQVGTPSFQDATGGGFEAPMGEPLLGFRTRGKMPDSKRTARAKARSRARRKTPRRLNSRR